MAMDVMTVVRRAHRLAFAALVAAIAAALCSGAALLDTEWGGQLLRRLAGDAPAGAVAVWRPGAAAPTYVDRLD